MPYLFELSMLLAYRAECACLCPFIEAIASCPSEPIVEPLRYEMLASEEADAAGAHCVNAGVRPAAGLRRGPQW